MAANDYRWCVEERDTGLPVAQGSAPTEAAANTEMWRYVLQYGADGPVRFWVRHNRKTVVEGQFSGFKVTKGLQ